MKYYKISEYLYLVIGSVILIDLLLFKESITDNLHLLLFCALSFSMYFLDVIIGLNLISVTSTSN